MPASLRGLHDGSPITLRPAVVPGDLAALLDDGPPANIEDLKALVLDEMAVAQRKLIGDDLDSVVEFWTDAGIPREENRCRDRWRR